MQQKERPILFSAPMVRAILDGRKTQTRRVVKHELLEGDHPFAPTGSIAEITGESHQRCGDYGALVTRDDFGDVIKCPYGKPGDRLWVRETWAAPVEYDGISPSGIPQHTPIYCRADDYRDRERQIGGHLIGRWRPSIHMPRWASRINLELTNVRIEELHSISGIDAKREGISIPAHLPADGADLDYARRHFSMLWKGINGKESWGVNPWVWVVEFKYCQA